MYYLKLTRWKNDGLAGFTAGSISAILVYWTNQKNEFGIKDKNDWIGHKLDVGIDAVEKSAETDRQDCQHRQDSQCGGG